MNHLRLESTFGGVAPVLEAEGFEVTYRSLLVKNKPHTPVEFLGIIGVGEVISERIAETLGVRNVHIADSLLEEGINNSGLYIVKIPEADDAQHLLGRSRLISPNGVARIICQ